MQLVMAVVVVSLDRRFLDGPVHALDLTIGPRVVWPGQSMLDPNCLADHVEAHLARICFVPVPGLLGELDAIVGQDRMNAIRDGLEQMFEEFPHDLAICLFHELRDSKFAGPVNAHKEIELSFHGLNLGDVDVKKADGGALELLPLWLVAFDVRQAQDAMPLKAPM